MMGTALNLRIEYVGHSNTCVASIFVLKPWRTALLDHLPPPSPNFHTLNTVIKNSFNVFNAP